jgi:hypothetical protein
MDNENPNWIPPARNCVEYLSYAKGKDEALQLAERVGNIIIDGYPATFFIEISIDEKRDQPYYDCYLNKISEIIMSV